MSTAICFCLLSTAPFAGHLHRWLRFLDCFCFCASPACLGAGEAHPARTAKEMQRLRTIASLLRRCMRVPGNHCTPGTARLDVVAQQQAALRCRQGWHVHARAQATVKGIDARYHQKLRSGRPRRGARPKVSAPSPWISLVLLGTTSQGADVNQG